ncbi:MAG TPA: hypothetical protein VFZ66_24895 [Herpetosiphonaceae bacterium]
MNIRWFHLLILGSMLLALWPARGSAQQNAVTWQIEAGFNGSYKAGTWFPVVVTISNTGADLRGTLSVQLRSGSALSYRQAIDLPQGAKKRVVIHVKSDANDGGSVRADVTLRDDTAVVLSERVNLNVIQSFNVVVGILSDEEGALPELANITQRQANQVQVMRLDGANLPDRAELLQAFDAIFVHALSTSTFTDAQREALRQWLDSGGQLVVGGDNYVAQELSALLPATIGGSAGSSNLQGLQAIGWSLRDANRQVPLLQVQPKTGARVLASNQAGQPLLVQQRYGSGTIVMTAFGLETLRDVGNTARLWERLLALDVERSPFWETLRSQGFSILRDSLQLPEIGFISALGLLGFLVLYILAVGPLNYLILQRLNRREWAYATIPLWVLLFTVGAYLWGTGGRGRAVVVNQLAIVRVPQQATQGQALTYVSLFSPTRATYSLQFASQALVSNVEDFMRQGQRLNVLYTEGGVEVPDLTVDVGGVSLLTVEQAVAAPQLAAVLRVVDGEQQMTLRNLSDRRLADVVLLRGDGQVQEIDALEPGAERTIVLRPDHYFYEQLNISGGNAIRRNAVIGQLGRIIQPGAFFPGDFGPVPAVPPPPVMEVEPVPGGVLPTATPATIGEQPATVRVQPDPQQIWYVLGWQPQSPVELNLDGSPVQAEGETLYIWTAQEEQ